MGNAKTFLKHLALPSLDSASILLPIKSWKSWRSTPHRCDILNSRVKKKGRVLSGVPFSFDRETQNGRVETAMTDATETTEELSGKKSARATAKKSAKGKSRKAKSGTAKKHIASLLSDERSSAGSKSATLEEARQDLVRKVCSRSGEITDKLVDEALLGKHLCAKFLFEAVGLCAMKDDEEEEVVERESLAGLLLKQWRLPTQATASCEVTEVSEAAPAVSEAEEAPVKS